MVSVGATFAIVYWFKLKKNSQVLIAKVIKDVKIDQLCLILKIILALHFGRSDQLLDTKCQIYSPLTVQCLKKM